MKNFISLALLSATILCTTKPVFADDINTLKQEFEQMKLHYEKRIQALEQKAQQEKDYSPQYESAQPASRSDANAFNPAISLILDGRAASFRNKPEDYELPGFSLGGEAGLGSDGFAIGHSELTASANVDDKFRGQFTLAFAEHDGETETEVEEAFFETLGLGQGFTVRGGRFFSGLGYINQQHNHAWDFADAPLVYAGLWGNKYIDDGLRLSWIAPTDMYLELGTEAFAGGKFPAGGEASSGSGSHVYFANLGGDVGDSHNWQLGVSHFNADVEQRETSGHGHDDGSEETPSFTGDSDVNGLSAIYKWAPDGNFKYRHFTLQGEYFQRDEDGMVTMLNSGPPAELTTYDGDQSGFYLQAVYQFMPQWRVGVRYDKLHSDNHGADMDVLSEAGLYDEGISPERHSAILEWNASEFSRFRLQFNRDESYEDTDNQIILQYTMSLGAHGSHTF